MIKKNKSPRRTKAEIGVIKTAIYNMLEVENPMTLRQLFYRLVSDKIIEKSEKEYKNTIGRLSTEMRLKGELPFHWFSDHTRFMRKPDSYSSAETMLLNTVTAYRRNAWVFQNDYIEIWMEKDALSNSILPVTQLYDVPLMISRGYASISYLHAAARNIELNGKPTFIYYLGDYDASGQDIPRDLEAKLRRFAPDSEIAFEIIGVTPQQIENFNLPTRPSKTSDSRAKNFDSTISVEVDAIPPEDLRKLVREKIESHIDLDEWDRSERIEKYERETYLNALGNLNFDIPLAVYR